MKKNKQTHLIGTILTLIVLGILLFISSLNSYELRFFSSIQNGIQKTINKIQISKDNEIFAKQQGKDIRTIEKENLDLLRENQELKLKMRELEVIKAKNFELEEMLELKKKYVNFEGVVAKVINRSINDLEHTVTIDVGKKHGVEEDMAVVHANGLYGKVISVTEDTSKVQIITDPASKISVQVGNEIDRIVAKGDLAKGVILKMLPIPPKVVSGQDIFTSGIASIFPKGIYIGTINTVNITQNNIDSYATINLPNSLNNITKVMVLKKENKK